MGKEDYKNEKKGHGFLCVPKELLFRELNNKHIRYVLFILKNNKKKINNIKQYLLTVLFNAPATCCSFFQNQTFDK